MDHQVDTTGRVAATDHGRGLPPSIKDNAHDAAAFYSILEPIIAPDNAARQEIAAEIALAITNIIKSWPVVDIRSYQMAQNAMCLQIHDYLCDIVRDQKGIAINDDELDTLHDRIMDLALARFPASP